MGLFTNPLSYAGYPPNVTGRPETQNTTVRAATLAEVEEGLIDYAYVSPATASGLDSATFASPPALGSTTPNAVTGTSVTITTAALQASPVVVSAAASPQTANGRLVRVSFSGVSIASGATQSFTITNSAITATSTNVRVSWFGATAGSGLSIASITPAVGSVAIVMTNATSATMVTSVANITFDVWVVN